MNKPWIAVGGVALLALIAAFLILGGKKDSAPSPANTIAEETRTVSYQCEDDMTIAAAFNQDIVVLSLLDGRQLVLQRDASSRASYANENGTLVFTSRENEAYLEEFGRKTYHDCVPQQ